MKRKKSNVIPNRLENIHQEQMRQEKIRQEKEKIREKARQRQREREIKEDRIQFKLKKFSLTEREVEILFGRIWRQRLARTDEEFFERELARLVEKIDNDCNSFLNKIGGFAEKFFDLIDYYVIWYNKKYNGWDKFDCENFREDWDEIRELWEQDKYAYQRHYNNAQKKYKSQKSETPQEISTISDAFDMLGLEDTATAQQIKGRYRELIIKYHPDKNSSPNAEEMTRKLTLAYDLLKKRGFVYTEAAV
jgi:curved DNA-binding protein CbpA